MIKPTKGDFLHDYQNRNHLHIGLTNSKGFVVEYDSQGIHRDKTLDWKNCIAISLDGAIDRDVTNDPDWPEYWDMCLEVQYLPSLNKDTIKIYRSMCCRFRVANDLH